MDYLQFSHAILTLVATYSPLLYGLGLLSVIVAATIAFRHYRPYFTSPPRKALPPVSVKCVTQEAPTLDDEYENISYNDALLLLDMFGAGVEIHTHDKRGNAKKLGLNGLSAAQMKEILGDANKIEAIAHRRLSINVTGDRHHHYYIPEAGAIV